MLSQHTDDVTTTPLLLYCITCCPQHTIDVPAGMCCTLASAFEVSLDAQCHKSFAARSATIPTCSTGSEDVSAKGCFCMGQGTHPVAVTTGVLLSVVVTSLEISDLHKWVWCARSHTCPQQCCTVGAHIGHLYMTRCHVLHCTDTWAVAVVCGCCRVQHHSQLLPVVGHCSAAQRQ